MLAKKSKLSVTPVANRVIAKIFPAIVPFLDKGKKYWEDYYGLEDILEHLISGRLQLFVGIDQDSNTIKLVMLTSIENYPKSKWVKILYIGGENLKDALCYYKEFETWARNYDCRGVEIVTRDGIAKVLRPLKFVKKANWLVKKFEDC